jgi:peptidoglycan lytic transglycosylase F
VKEYPSQILIQAAKLTRHNLVEPKTGHMIPPILRQNCWQNGSLLWLCISLMALILSGCGQPSVLEKIEKRNTLHVITRNAPAVYYEGREGPVGFEYELAKLFAEDLGVDLNVKVASTRSQILSALDNKYTNFAAALIVSGDSRAEEYQYSTPYLETTPLVVYRYGSTRPKNIQAILGKRIAVVSDSYLNLELDELKKAHPQLEWEALDLEIVDLMRMVQEKEIDYAVITSIELELHQAFYPRVKKGFALGPPQSIGWYFPLSKDKSLLDRANAFLTRVQSDGTLMYLKERYFGHLSQLNYVGARTFIRHTKQRLPKYLDTYKKVSEEYNVDWRLMAAIGYQESHWRPNATSPTGVRGLMMLTQVTAKEMGIENRLIPSQSILGGIKYFARVHKRVPDDIEEPDRTWFALASYNVGYGHVDDARKLTEKAGKDSKKWADVKDFLPLLQKKKYYSQTKHGYARGNEPVIYVQNIRRYYDVLNWISESTKQESVLSKNIFEERLIKYQEQ